MCKPPGTDNEVNRFAAILTKEILQKYMVRKRMRFDIELTVDYRKKDGIKNSITIPVIIRTCCYNDLGPGEGDTNIHNWIKNKNNPVYIRVSMKGGSKWITPEMICDTVSHELMHVKNLVRETLECRTEGTDLFISYEEDDELGELQYFLSDNELSSYVQGIYSWCKEGTKKIIKKKGRKPTHKEFEKLMKRSMSWRWLEECEIILSKAKAEDIEDRIYFQNNHPLVSHNAFRRLTGIGTTAESFKIGYSKKLRQAEKKMVKASYAGYTDAISFAYN